ncbi:MAG: TIGR03087 family PEP-CTERM/XrtA system glycosyltransferase [Pseudomonadota bacterium]
MSGRREALFVAHRIPYPPDKGDKIRSWRLFQRLKAHFDVRLCAFVDDPDDFQHKAFLEAEAASVALVPLNRRAATVRSASGFLTGEPLSMPYYRDARLRRAVEDARARPLAVEVAFSSTTAQYLALGRGGRRGRNGGAPRIVDLCDADSEKWRAYAKERRFPMNAVYAREADQLALAEADIINEADAAFAASPAEAKLLAGLPGVGGEVDWVSNGVDADYFVPGATAAARDGGDVVFTGAMDYRANVDAALWFAERVWPRVRAKAPDATLAIVGARPAVEVTALDGRDGVCVTGRVPDVRPYLERARVAIAPMRIARGLQNKVMEAMAAERPVVATPAAAEGLAVAPGEHYRSAATPVAFAEAVVRLLSNADEASALAAAGRRLMVEEYSWAARLRRFDAILARVGAL